jgi:hypothetical protein
LLQPFSNSGIIYFCGGSQPTDDHCGDFVMSEPGFSLRSGDEIALYRPYDIAAEKQAATQPQSSWQEHLQAIREGRLELLERKPCSITRTRWIAKMG